MEKLLSQLQKERNEWVAHNFPDEGLLESVLGFAEEAGELVHHFLKHHQGIRGSQAEHVEGMLDSVADGVIFGLGVGTHLNADFGQLVTMTWQQVQKRDWIKYPQNGVSE